MTQPVSSTNLNDDLPLHKKLIADLLAAGLDLLGGHHPASWHQGHASASSDRGAKQEEGAPTRVILEYRPDTIVTVPQCDTMIFGAQRLDTNLESKSRMRADCGRYLPPDKQPTSEQWKAIFSGSPTTSVVGAAGSGKTFTILLRVIYLNRYLQVPLSEITVLTFGRESRQDTAAKLQTLLASWQVEISLETALRVVKTPRAALIEQVRSVPDLGGCVPFEVLSATALDALDDGRPFDATLTPRQQVEMSSCLNLLYRTNKRFADLVQDLFGASLQIPDLGVDSPEVIKRAPLAWKLSAFDTELCDTLEALWKKAGMWPLEGVQASRRQFTLRGRTYSSSGYIPQLKMHVVLGFDRSEDRYLQRSPTAGVELYKEVAIKRTLLQGYFQGPLLHLDSYQEAFALVEALKALPKAPPSFSYKLSGSDRRVPILELFNEVASVIDALGLEVAAVPGKMNFLAGDSDAAFFEALGMYWQALERHLAALHQPSYPFGRLFDLFSDRHAANLRHVPMRVLGQCRHVLVDNGEDYTVPVAGWLRGVLAEIRRRDSGQAVARDLCASLLVAGDVSQWVFGSYGTSPKMVTDIEEIFPAVGGCSHVHLLECFRSHQLIIDAGQNLIRNLPASSGRGTRAAGRAAREPAPIQMQERQPAALLALCKEAIKEQHQVLVLIDSHQDREWVDSEIGDLIRHDRACGSRKIRVRSFHKAKALQADVVILVGDPAVRASSWYRNQLYKLAGFSVGGDSTPGDTVLDGEAQRLAHVAVTRARRRCYWFHNREEGGSRTATNLVTLSAELFQQG